jgi:2-polyprenyl-3-methyl-5-hydroxy-6-metoxy-1,4-benzoquinol methylase
MSKEFLCPVCQTSSKVLYKALEDHIYRVDYRADLYICRNDSCRHVFVAPEPSQEQIGGFYKNYSTHSIREPNQTVIAKVYDFLCNVSGFIDQYARQKKDLAFAGLENRAPGDILDVGCGSGAVLHRLTLRGWRNCHGIDFDENAVSVARSRGLTNVKVASLESLNNGDTRYNYILLNHVIEHLPNPEHDLRLASSLLNENGKIIIRTPNNQSLLAKFLKSKWRGWEPPRHLHVFSNASLEILANKVGLKVSESYTSNGMLQGTFFESMKILALKKGSFASRVIAVSARMAFPVAVLFLSLIHKVDNRTGEELVVVLEKAR